MPSVLVQPEEAQSSPGWTPDMPVPRETVRQLRERLAARRKEFGGLYPMFATFRAPVNCSQQHFEGLLRKAIEAWVKVQDSRGYVLQSKPVLGKRSKPAHAYRGDWAGIPLLDEREYTLGALFSAPHAKPVRMEIPVTGE